MAANEITCHELVELVTDYLEGAMLQSDRDRIEAHLSGCEHCLRYLQQMKHTIRGAGSLREAPASASAPNALLEAFRTWKQR